VLEAAAEAAAVMVFVMVAMVGNAYGYAPVLMMFA